MTSSNWDLFGFMAALREWMLNDPPPGALLAKVAAFGDELERDPEFNAELDGGNLYWRRIPDTEHSSRIVVISYTLSRPKPKGPGLVECKSVYCLEHPHEPLFGVHPVPPHHQPSKKR